MDRLQCAVLSRTGSEIPAMHLCKGAKVAMVKGARQAKEVEEGGKGAEPIKMNLSGGIPA